MMNNVDQFLKGLQIRGMRIFRRASGALSNEPPLWFVRGRESAAMCDHTYSSVPFPQDFDKDNLPEICCATVEKQFMSNPNFNPDYIRNKSGAAAGLCAWVVNICKYFRIYQVGCTYNCDDETKPTRRRVHKQPSLCVAWWYRTGHCLLSGRLLSVVAPKRAALAEANKKLDQANKKLSGIRAKVKELQDRVTALEEGLMKATEDKNAAIAQADKTQQKADLADRLVNGLSSENKRWGEAIEEFAVMEEKLVSAVSFLRIPVGYEARGCRREINHLPLERVSVSRACAYR
eukprot:174494-Prorocentrum_minimum.AAC.1